MTVAMRRRCAFVLLCALLFVPAAGAWTWPVHGPVLQTFDFDQAHPYGAGQHRGIAIGAATGTAVLAPAAGVVSFAGSVPTSGQTLTILTPSGVAVSLTHLGSIAVARNAAVDEGAPVGTIGPSGTPEFDVPYVHLGIRDASNDQGYLDPLQFLPVLPPPAAPDPPAAPAPAPAPAPVAAPVTPVAAPVPVAAPAPAPQPEPAPPTAAPAPVEAPAAPVVPATPAVEVPPITVVPAAPTVNAPAAAPTPLTVVGRAVAVPAHTAAVPTAPLPRATPISFSADAPGLPPLRVPAPFATSSVPHLLGQAHGLRLDASPPVALPAGRRDPRLLAFGLAAALAAAVAVWLLYLRRPFLRLRSFGRGRLAA